MPAHSNHFKAEVMHALGGGFVAARQQRQELLIQIRSHTRALLAAARSKRGEDEGERRKSAARDADARRLFTRELRSEVHALRNRFKRAFRHLAKEVNDLQEAARAVPSLEAATRASAHTAAPAPGIKKKAASPRPQPKEVSPPPREKRQRTPPPRKRGSQKEG